MTTYYVSVKGNDAHQGSINRPFATIRQALNVIQPGDTVLIREGTYYQSKGLWLGQKHSGTSQSRTVIRAFPGENVTIDGWDQSSNNLINIEGDYIDIIGLTWKNSPGHAIGVWGGDNVQIKNNTIHETQRGGIIAHGKKDNNGNENRIKNLTIEGNRVYRTNLANQNRSSLSGWDSGINASRADNVTIKKNIVYHNYGEGISLTLASNSVISGNTTYDNYSVEVYLDNTKNSIAEQNFIYNTKNSDYYRKICGSTCHWLPAVGIQLANEDYGVSNYFLNNNVIRNNIVVGVRTGLAYGAYETSRGIKNTLIANNTFYGATEETLHIDADNDNSNVMFSNNIFDQGKTRLTFFLPSQNGLKFERNLRNAPSSLSTTGNFPASSSDIIADPLFIKPEGLKASDYQLRAGSKAIDAGIFIDSITNDFFNRRRQSSDKFDIGAVELQTSNLKITGTGGNDSLKGKKGDDILRGQGGNDVLVGAMGDDRLLGSQGNDKMNGGQGNDTLIGGPGADTLYGANSFSTSKNSIDILKGGLDSDTFILGNKVGVFYNDDRSQTPGLKDFARLTDFDKDDDVIQLHGAANLYHLSNTSPLSSIGGKALYYDHNRNGFDTQDELIAIIQSSQNLSLSAQYFAYK